MSRQPVTVHIEELSLTGFSRSQGRQVAAALQYELETLLSSRGIPPGWADSGHIETLRGPLEATAGPDAGASAARTIFGGADGCP
jgi:hypothetical protein